MLKLAAVGPATSSEEEEVPAYDAKDDQYHDNFESDDDDDLEDAQRRYQPPKSKKPPRHNGNSNSGSQGYRSSGSQSSSKSHQSSSKSHGSSSTLAKKTKRAGTPTLDEEALLRNNSGLADRADQLKQQQRRIRQQQADNYCTPNDAFTDQRSQISDQSSNNMARDKSKELQSKVTNLRKDLQQTKKQLQKEERVSGQLEETIRELRVEINRGKTTITTLRKQITDLTGTVTLAKSTRMEEKKDYNEGFAKMVKSKVQRSIWRNYKFINNPEQEQHMCMRVLDELRLAGYMRTTDKAKNLLIDEKRLAFCDVYSGHAREALNEQRSYVQTRGKEAIYVFMTANGSGCYPLEDIIKVATRDIPLKEDNKEEHDRLMEVFVWYWEDYLPGFAGNTYWCKEIRRFQSITLANFKNRLCVTISTEAMAVLMYENCLNKWVALFNWTEGGTVKNKKIPKKKRDPLSAQFRGVYSDGHSGQAKYGGWNDAGLVRFNDLGKLIKVGRKSENAATLEQDCLVLIKERFPEDADGPPVPQKKARKRKRASKVTISFVDDDDEEDGFSTRETSDEEEGSGEDAPGTRY